MRKKGFDPANGGGGGAGVPCPPPPAFSTALHRTQIALSPFDQIWDKGRGQKSHFSNFLVN